VHGDLRWELHWQFGRRLPLCYNLALTRAAAAALISQGDAQLYTDWLPDDASFASRSGSVGKWLLPLESSPPVAPRVTEMSQSDAWPSDYSTVDALSRYKHQFTASVKLHTSPATRATWDDHSANVPLQTIWPLP
jgi:hypothetical protein